MNAHARIADALAKEQRPAVATVILSLPFPISVNRLWTRGRTGMIKTPRYETWSQAAGIELKQQHPGRIDGPFAADILVERKDNRKRDLDNTTKCIFDLLQEHGVIENDSLLQDLRLRWSPTVRGAAVLLTALPSANRQPQKVAA